MTNVQFLEQFGHFVDAPNGIQKLRELILQLAVQGKLVPQDPDDEPASVLLEKIKEKKRQHVKEKVTRKTKLPVLPNEPPNHELPSPWVWTNLYEIGEISPRNNHDDDIKASFIPMKCISATYSVPVQHEIRQWKEIKSGFTHFKEGDVVLAKITPCFQNGKSAVVRGLTNGFGAGTTELHVYRPPINSIVPEYVLIYLKSPGFIHEGIPKMTGTAGQKRITRDYFAGNHFPLPPLGEQSRIVTRVDELMILCDQLEAEHKARNENRTRLIRAVHHPLTEASNSGVAHIAWQRIRDNFNGLYTTPESIQALRQTILQLAVQGKLVPQDSNDLPTRDSLNKIKAEKSLLVKEGKFKSLDSENIIEEDRPYPIPKNWAWCLLDDIAAIARGGSPRPIKSYLTDNPDGLNWIKIGDSVRGSTYINNTREKIRPEGLGKTRMVYPGDLILSNSMSFGYPYILNIEGCIHDGWLLIRIPDQLIYKLYIYYLFRSSHAMNSFSKAAAGAVVQNLNADKVRRLQVPLPPLAEQSRIVTKVDELMTLCDQLETQINNKSTTASRYAEAIVQQIATA